MVWPYYDPAWLCRQESRQCWCKHPLASPPSGLSCPISSSRRQTWGSLPSWGICRGPWWCCRCHPHKLSCSWWVHCTPCLGDHQIYQCQAALGVTWWPGLSVDIRVQLYTLSRAWLARDISHSCQHWQTLELELDDWWLVWLLPLMWRSEVDLTVWR